MADEDVVAIAKIKLQVEDDGMAGFSEQIARMKKMAGDGIDVADKKSLKALANVEKGVKDLTKVVISETKKRQLAESIATKVAHVDKRLQDNATKRSLLANIAEIKKKRDGAVHDERMAHAKRLMQGRQLKEALVRDAKEASEKLEKNAKKTFGSGFMGGLISKGGILGAIFMGGGAVGAGRPGSAPGLPAVGGPAP